MSTENVVRTIKVVHPSCVVIVKIGNFYNVYSKDAYIFSYLFKYKIKENYDVPICGFPITSIVKVQKIYDKILKEIENKNSYEILDKIEMILKNA